MTFLAMGRAKECIVALSDRMESVSHSHPNEVTKYDLSDAGEYYIALSGDGKTAGGLLSRLRLRQPSGAGVLGEIDRISAELFAMELRGQVAGHLIVAGGGEFRAYTIAVVSGIAVYVQNNDPIHMEGDTRAAAVCRNLALDMPLADMPCETAVKCLHSMAGRIAETVDSVGDGGKHGEGPRRVRTIGMGGVKSPGGAGEAKK